MEVIKAKLDGLTLESHINSVYMAATQFNNMLGTNFDDNLLYYFSILHDLGKANPIWIESFRDKSIVFRHEISSIFFIDCVPKKYRYDVKMAVLSHHKSVKGGEDISDFTYRSFYNLFGEIGDPKFWKNHIGDIEWRERVVRFLKEQYNIECEVPTDKRCNDIIEETLVDLEKLKPGYSQLLGICMMGDHFGSCFPDEGEMFRHFGKLFVKPNMSVYSGKDPRYPFSLIDSDPTKSHTLIKGPTGGGKTRMGMRRCKKRVFYLLPFQASINAMYKRFCKDFEKQGFSIGLRHGSRDSVDFMDVTTKKLSDLYGLPITVITPFQIMAICLRLKGYEAIINDLAGNDIVCDEIHTYNGLSKTAVYELLKFLKSIGCRIHVLTATMPTDMERHVLDILGKDNTQVIELPEHILETFNRHRVHCIEKMDYDSILERYKNGEKVLIVRNQRSLAIDTYKKLNESVDDNDIILVHMSMERGTRSIVEDKIYEFNRRKTGCILVSTQVVEVSIDINFDCLFTDCADICSLIQRFGRVNRQRKKIGLYKDVFVIKPTGNKFRNNWLPYDEKIVKKTYDVFEKIDGKIIEESKIQSMIDEVHPHDDIILRSSYCPVNFDGKWKSLEYCHCVNDSVSKELEMVGYTGVCESKIDYYVRTHDKSVEIPLGIGAEKKLRKYTDSILIVPDSSYNEKLGYFGK